VGTYELNFVMSDFEGRLGLLGKKYTAVNNVLSCVLGGGATVIFYLCLYPLHLKGKWQMVDMFFHGGNAQRSSIPYYTMFLTFWCLVFLFIKWLKLHNQRRALSIDVIPDNPGYVVSRMNAHDIISAIHAKVFMSEHYMVLWRMECALQNLDHIGKISEVSSVLKDQADTDAEFTESTYTLPKGLIWAIPVLGFIGTVLGLSQAVGGFGNVVASGADLEGLKNALSGVTSGLAIAFETTLIALVDALVVQLLMTFLMQKEEEFLDQVARLCYRKITSKLRMVDLVEQMEETDPVFKQ